MRTALAFAVLIAAPAAAQDAKPLFEGVTHRTITHTGDAPMIVQVVAIDLTRSGVRLTVTAPDRSKGMEHVAATVSQFLIRERAQVAVNASYFLPFNGGSPRGEDFYPKSGQPVQVSGAAIGGGRVASPVETDQDNRVTAIVCIRRAAIRIVDGQRCPRGTTDAVAAGPRLLTGGARTPLPPYEFSRDDAKGPRTAFGISADRKTAWLVTVDGRQAGYSMGASLNDLTVLFRDIGAADAINLDGGGSTTMAIADGRGGATLLNRPIHTGIPGRERPVANHIAVFAPPLVARR